VRLLPPIELAPRRIRRRPALNRSQWPLVHGPLAQPLDQPRADVQRDGNRLIGPARPRRAFVGFEQNARARQFACRCPPLGHQPFERLPLVGRQSYAMGFHLKAYRPAVTPPNGCD
jgi:hypothetical protein